jgi:hypothetical protein
MAEFFGINPSGNLDPRSEMWLAEADDFGMILMAEGKSPLICVGFRNAWLTRMNNSKCH